MGKIVGNERQDVDDFRGGAAGWGFISIIIILCAVGYLLLHILAAGQ